MKTIDMLQNSEDWYKMRNNYLGASDANIILGQSKFRTPLQLWKIKTGEPQKENKEGNFIQEKGHRMEEKMRNIMEMVLDTELKPLVVTSESYPFLMASLDGYDEESGATWECKYVGQDAFDEVSNGKMMMNYYPQVQQQIMLTGAPFCYFTVVTDDKESTNPNFPFKYTFMEVPADLNFMEKTLLPAMVDFWDKIQNKISPEMSHDDVLDMSDDEKLVDLVGQYYGAKLALEEITKKEKELKAEIFKITKAKKVTCNGVKITQSKPSEKTSFDYKKFEKENGIPEGFSKVTKTASRKSITFPKAESSDS